MGAQQAAGTLTERVASTLRWWMKMPLQTHNTFLTALNRHLFDTAAAPGSQRGAISTVKQVLCQTDVGAPSTAAISTRPSQSAAERKQVAKAGKLATGKGSRWGAPRVVRNRPPPSSPLSRHQGRRAAARGRGSHRKVLHGVDGGSAEYQQIAERPKMK